MGQAKQRGTYAERVQQAQASADADSAAKREAAWSEAQARRRAALDAEQAERVDLRGGRAVVVSGGRGRLVNQALITAALIAALGPVR